MTEELHPNLRHLPFGAPDLAPRTDFTAWGVFPYAVEGDALRLRTLEPPLEADPPRSGEAGAHECDTCAREDETFLWTDENWRLSALREHGASPAALLLFPRAHADLADLPAEAAAQLGPMIQRVERAVTAIGGVGRVHMYRWGDGSAHLHLWFMARPVGVPQLRGSFMALWDDLLPAIGEERWRANLGVIAAAMAEGGGVAH